MAAQGARWGRCRAPSSAPRLPCGQRGLRSLGRSQMQVTRLLPRALLGVPGRGSLSVAVTFGPHKSETLYEADYHSEKLRMPVSPASYSRIAPRGRPLCA